jgi:hypothetical protein
MKRLQARDRPGIGGQGPSIGGVDVDVELDLEGAPETIPGGVGSHQRIEVPGVERYRHLRSRHLIPIEARALDGGPLLLRVRTAQSQIQIAQVAPTRVLEEGAVLTCERRTAAAERLVAEEVVLEIGAQRPVTVEKVVGLYTSRDRAISEAGLAAV